MRLVRPTPWLTPWLFMGLLTGSLACTSFEEDRGAAAQDVVRRFFAALPSGDCAVLAPLLASAKASDCEASVAAVRERGLSLVRVLDVQGDGRDETVMLVRARVSRQGRELPEPLLLRVERHPEGWKLRL
jgi:hypothetical protein